MKCHPGFKYVDGKFKALVKKKLDGLSEHLMESQLNRLLQIARQQVSNNSDPDATISSRQFVSKSKLSEKSKKTLKSIEDETNKK